MTILSSTCKIQVGGICIILMLIYNTEYIKYVTYGIGIFSIPNKT